MIGSYCTDSITLIAPASKDEWGEPSGPETEIPLKARVEFKSKLVRDLAGNEVMSVARVVFRTRTVDPESKIRLDDYSTDEHGILSVSRPKDFRDRFVELMLA